jgi:hypothetical protein
MTNSMPTALTRRPDPDAADHGWKERWLIHYGDVEVGEIRKRDPSSGSGTAASIPAPSPAR